MRITQDELHPDAHFFSFFIIVIITCIHDFVNFMREGDHDVSSNFWPVDCPFCLCCYVDQKICKLHSEKEKCTLYHILTNG